MGCWPEHHGIVTNKFLDGDGRLYDHSRDADWATDCEHLHEVAERQGVRAAALDWYGARSYYARPLASMVDASEGHDTLPRTTPPARTRWRRCCGCRAEQRPRLILAYFRGPDSAAHFSGMQVERGASRPYGDGRRGRARDGRDRGRPRHENTRCSSRPTTACAPVSHDRERRAHPAPPRHPGARGLDRHDRVPVLRRPGGDRARGAGARRPTRSSRCCVARRLPDVCAPRHRPARAAAHRLGEAALLHRGRLPVAAGAALARRRRAAIHVGGPVPEGDARLSARRRRAWRDPVRVGRPALQRAPSCRTSHAIDVHPDRDRAARDRARLSDGRPAHRRLAGDRRGRPTP